MLIARPVAIVLAGYLLGCFCTGYYLVRLRTGADIRNLGSGSAGGRNVGRQLGVPGFIITLLGDLLKGALATWIAMFFGLGPIGVLAAVAAVVVGHIWPIQLGFRGGKGLATALGAGLVFDYRLVIIAFVLAGLIFAVMRRLTLSGLVAVMLTPGVAAMLGYPATTVLSMMLIVLIILIAHRSNIRAVLKGARY